MSMSMMVMVRRSMVREGMFPRYRYLTVCIDSHELGMCRV